MRDLLEGSDGPVLVACSGGADSLALAAATAFVAPGLGLTSGLVTVDHGLQPGSAQRADAVVALAAGMGLDPAVHVTAGVGRDGGPEAAARTARYAALDEMAGRYGARVLLGHTLDDQAETVLLGLGRGSGVRSIAGMAAVDGIYLRPFLALRSATTAAACEALGLEPWADPHNLEARFQRVRLRREVLPLLEQVLQGGVAEALARTAGLLRDDLDALDSWADTVLAAQPLSWPPCGDDTRLARRSGAKGYPALDVGLLAGLPRAVRTRVLRAWASPGSPLTAERTAALDRLVTDWHGQGPINLPGGVTVCRASGRLELAPEPEPEQRGNT